MPTNSTHIAIGAITAITMMALYIGAEIPLEVITALGAYAVGRQVVKSTKGK